MSSNGLEESAAQESAAQESLVQESLVQESVGQESLGQESAAQESAAQESLVQESVVQESLGQESAAQESAAQESAAQESSPQESSPQEFSPQESAAQESAAQESAAQESSAQESSAQESAAQESSAQESSAQESAAQESSAQESLQSTFDTIGYLTVTGPFVLPTDPAYTFDDNFVFLTEAQLKSMSTQEIANYKNTVSTSIGLEYSTLAVNQANYAIYNLYIQLYQSTINGVKYQLQYNAASNYTLKQIQTDLDLQDKNTRIKIEYYESEIDEKTKIMDESISSISSLSRKLSSLDLTIPYIGGGLEYSTLYIKSLGYDALIAEKEAELDKLNADVDTAAFEESTLYKNYVDSTLRWKITSNTLDKLHTRSNAIRTMLTRSLIDIATAEDEYNSTVVGISTLSSLRELVSLRTLYENELAKLAAEENNYIDSQNIFTTADVQYQNIWSGGSIQNVTNTSATSQQSIALQARSMAQAQLYEASTSRHAARLSVSKLQTLLGLAKTSHYEATLDALEATVVSKSYLANTLKNYKLSSLQSVARFSSIYENANIDISTYSGLVKVYSSMYESSIIGASTMSTLNSVDQDRLKRLQEELTVTTHTLSILDDKQKKELDDYEKYILISSIHTRNMLSSMYAASTLSSLYYSTQNAIDFIKYGITSTNKGLIIAKNLFYAQSSILNSQYINLSYLDMQLNDSINTQERAAYEYRETFCRLQKINISRRYDGMVLGVIEAASNATVAAQATSATPVAAIVPNLNTPEIKNTYTTLTSINSFITSFSEIYNAYDEQSSNIKNISTCIDKKSKSWSTLQFYDDAMYYSGYSNTELQPFITSASADYSNKTIQTNDAIEVYSTAQKTIISLKNVVYNKYKSFFGDTDIENQESTISSFMVQGYKQASLNLLKQNLPLTF